MPERGNVFLRFLDRILGIPLVFFVSLFHRSRARPGVFRRIALLKTAAIGDTVLISAVVRDIRERLPTAEIHFFVGENNREAAELLSGINRVIPLPVKNPLRAVPLIRRMNEYDLLLDFGQWPRLDALLSWSARARWKVGFKTEGQFRHGVYDVAVTHSRDIHEFHNYKNLLEPIDLKGSHLPHISIEENPGKKSVIVVHMFAGGYKACLKEWPEERWIALINSLTATGKQITLTGHRDRANEARHLWERIKDKDKVRVAAGELDLRAMARLLKSSELVISVNTGIVHLAAALGCRIVTLHGPTSAKRWGPFDNNGLSLQSPLKCSPCLNLGFDYGCPRNDCMKAISVESVLSLTEETRGPLPGGSGYINVEAGTKPPPSGQIPQLPRP